MTKNLPQGTNGGTDLTADPARQIIDRIAVAVGVAWELAAQALLTYQGWTLEREYRHPAGHRIDFRGTHPHLPETLFEVKAWTAGGGTDTVREAFAVAYDLQAWGEERPYVLIMSHELVGLYGNMIRQAIDAGPLAECWLMGFTKL